MANTSTQAPDQAINHAASVNYWNSVDSTVSGMLRGFAHLSPIDIRGSFNFYHRLRSICGLETGQRIPHAVDAGAGIGRITFGFLVKIADSVDIVEPIWRFTEQLRQTTGCDELIATGRIGLIVNAGLENWVPNVPYKYDLIWTQWCIGHLTDVQLVAYLGRCREHLAEQGCIIVKENLSTDPDGGDIYDHEDSSVTRTDGKFRVLFDRAGLEILLTEIQCGFPRTLYPVRSYALRPIRPPSQLTNAPNARK